MLVTKHFTFFWVSKENTPQRNSVPSDAPSFRADVAGGVCLSNALFCS
jgi:hypothetical protein